MNNDNEINNPKDEDTYNAQIAKIVIRMHTQIEIPDGERAWLQLQKRLQAHQRRLRWWKTLKMGIVVASLSIVISLFSGITKETMAFHSLFAVMKQVKDGFVHVFYGSSSSMDTTGAKTSPPPDVKNQGEPPTLPNRKPSNDSKASSGVVKPEEATVETAKVKLEFPIRTAKYLPQGYSVYRVKLYPDADGKYRHVRIEYRNEDGDVFDLSESKLETSSSGWQTAISQSSGEIKDVDINGSKGILVIYKEGGLHLEWLSGDVVLMLQGKLSEDENLKIARSVKIEGMH